MYKCKVTYTLTNGMKYGLKHDSMVNSIYTAYLVKANYCLIPATTSNSN